MMKNETSSTPLQQNLPWQPWWCQTRNKTRLHDGKHDYCKTWEILQNFFTSRSLLWCCNNQRAFSHPCQKIWGRVATKMTFWVSSRCFPVSHWSMMMTIQQENFQNAAIIHILKRSGTSYQSTKTFAWHTMNAYQKKEKKANVFRWVASWWWWQSGNNLWKIIAKCTYSLGKEGWELSNKVEHLS